MSRIKAASTNPRPSRRVFDHEAAFRYWHNADGQRRTYREVAEEFGVSERGVFQAAMREDWPSRAWGIEEEARRQADRRATKTIAQRIEEDLRLIDAGKLAVARRLQAGTVDADLGDLVALIKTEMLLTGGASERVGVESEAHRRSLDEIERELADLPVEVVDAQLAADQIVERRVRELDKASEPDAAASETAVSVPIAAAEDEPEPSVEDEPSPAENGTRRVPYSQTEAYRRYEQRVLYGGGR